MIAHLKTVPWATSLRPFSLSQHFPIQLACALEGTLNTGHNCLLLTCYFPQDLAKHAEACLALGTLTTTYPDHLIILGGDFQGDFTVPIDKSCHLRTLPFTLLEGPQLPTFTQAHQVS